MQFCVLQLVFGWVLYVLMMWCVLICVFVLMRGHVLHRGRRHGDVPGDCMVLFVGGDFGFVLVRRDFMFGFCRKHICGFLGSKFRVSSFCWRMGRWSVINVFSFWLPWKYVVISRVWLEEVLLVLFW